MGITQPDLLTFKNLNLSPKSGPGDIVAWIVKNVPEFVGNVPPEWTDRLIKALEGLRIPRPIIVAALWMARGKGFVFTPTPYSIKIGYGEDENRVSIRTSLPPPYQTWRETTPQERNATIDLQQARAIAADLTVRYYRSKAAGDPSAMAGAVVAAIGLLWAYAKSRLAARKIRNEAEQRVREAEEANRAIDEAFEQSALTDRLRRLSADELARLRDMPEPDAEDYVEHHVIPEDVEDDDGEPDGE
jgi:hypothetical protein